ncbi:MAG: hypothetical protein ACJA2W_001756 [Planctomycetota bacterium]|jgi:hypothetical protein
MLRIRQEQLKVLEEVQLDRFKADAANHIGKFWSRAAEEQGEVEVAKTVATAVERTRTYRIDDEYDVLRYINLMYSLGHDFDRELKWAGDILNAPDRSGRNRMDELMEHALAEEDADGGDA